MSGETTGADELKAIVREHYGRVAQATAAGPCCGGNATSSCCGTQEGQAADAPFGASLYGGDELRLVPPDAAASSRGCGNPMALAGLQPGEAVLDLGSGGGLDALLAARRVGPSGVVYGVDMTDEMLALARRNALKVGAANVHFLKGDIESIPLPDASVDVIISNCVINLTPDKERALAEAFRVLRPGGRLAVSDVVVDGGLDGLPLPEEDIRAALSWAGCIAGALTSEQYRSYLTGAGFEDVNVAVEHRYTLEDVVPTGESCCGSAAALPETLPAWLSELAGRFTSSAVSAHKPR